MPERQIFHGQVVDLRRHVNVHLRHLRPFAPTDRYELWLRAPDGAERKFTLHTREMPARRGHELSLVTTTHRRSRVLALATGRRSLVSTTLAASHRPWCRAWMGYVWSPRSAA